MVNKWQRGNQSFKVFDIDIFFISHEYWGKGNLAPFRAVCVNVIYRFIIVN